MQQPPDPVQGFVAELSKRLDSIESNQRENIQALWQDIAETHRRIDRLTRWIIGIQLTTPIALGALPG